MTSIGKPPHDAPAQGHRLGQKRKRPFELSANWVTTNRSSSPRCNPGDPWVEFTGTGHGTFVGHCTLTAGHCTRVGQPPDCTSWYDGRWTITAEDGDKINMTFVGEFLAPGHATEGTDLITVVGGTGRFSGATGEMQGKLVFDWSNWPSDLPIKEEVRGWICF